MLPSFRWALAAALLPSMLSAAVAGQNGRDTAALPRPGDPACPYVVVTERQLRGPFMRLIEKRTHDGLRATVVTIESIESGYPSGVDRAERIRMFLKDAYANWGTRWVLLGGDASVVPMRRARLRFSSGLPPRPDIDLPTDQYYACLDGTWNADGDAFWGERPGDDVDIIPELYVGRAPVHDAAETVEFVRRTLEYEDRLSAGGPRSALLAADILGNIVDTAPMTEGLRSALEADPDRSVVRMYENAGDWPGSQQESRPALLEALDAGFDLAVLLGAGGRGVFVAGDDFSLSDYVTSGDLVGLTNAPKYPIVYMLSAFTTDPGPPRSIGAGLLLARRGGAAAVIGSTDLQFLAIGQRFMEEFFAQAFGAGTPPIGEALARAITAVNTQSYFGDITRLTSQGNLLLGDPTLHVDPAAAALLVRGGGRQALPAPGAGRDAAPDAAGGTAALDAVSGFGPSLAIAEPDAPRAARFVAAGPTPDRSVLPSPAGPGTTTSGLACSSATLRFDLPGVANGARYQLAIYDLLGRKVRTFAGGAVGSGRIERAWDLRSDAGTRVADGLYFARLSFAGISRVSRVLVVK